MQQAVAAARHESPRFGDHPKRREHSRYACRSPASRASPAQADTGDSEVVERERPRAWWRDAKRQDGDELSKVSGTDQAAGCQMCDVANRRCCSRRRQCDRHEGHTGELNDRHQRNRREVQAETRERHPRKEERADWQQGDFGCRGGRQQAKQPPNAARQVHRLHERNGQKNRKSGADRQYECGVDHGQRPRSNQAGGGQRQHVERRASLIERSSGKVDHRHQRRAIDRRAAADDPLVRDKHTNRRQHRAATEHPGHSEGGEQKSRQNRDVPAGNGDDVVGSRLLQAPLQLIVEARTVADDDGGNDCGGAFIPAANCRRNAATADVTNSGRRFVNEIAACDHLHERPALHRANERRAPPGQRPLEVRDARIQITGRPAKLDRQTHAPAAAPVTCGVGGQRAHDRSLNASGNSFSGTGPRLNRIDVNRERDAGRTLRCVGPQHAADDRKRPVLVFYPACWR